MFSQSSPMRLGIYENPPMTFLQNNVPAGFIVDVIADFARRQRLNLEYVRAPFHELFEKLQRGEVDIIAPIASISRIFCPSPSRPMTCFM